MKKIAEEKECKNCKYYVEHYVIISTRFYPIGGHCINDKLYNPHKKNPRALHENCDYWENNAGEKTERRKNIEEVLRSIDNHLYYIKNILEKDE